jgi:hypothetical protein
MSKNQEIEAAIENEADTDSGFAIAYAIGKLAVAVDSVAYQLKSLGLGGAATQMGAIEYLATKIDEAGDKISCALRDSAGEVSERITDRLKRPPAGVSEHLAAVRNPEGDC